MKNSNKKHSFRWLHIIILAQMLLIVLFAALILYLGSGNKKLPQRMNNSVNSVNTTSNNIVTTNTVTTNTTNTSNVPTNQTTGQPTQTKEDVSAALKETGALSYAAWDWSEGVAVQGLVNYADASGDAAVQALALQKLNELYPKAPKTSSDVILANQGILGEGALAAYAKTGDKKYLTTANTLGAAYLSWSATAPNGAFLHYYEKYCPKCGNKNYVWADTLYMTVPFLTKLSKATSDQKYVQKAASQIVLHQEYLQDQNGLIHHASKADGGVNNFQFWARANAWYLASSVDVLEHLSQSDPSYKKIQSSVQKQAAALVTYQDNGLWHTVVDHKETYTESSASALITYALLKAVRLGVISESYKAQAQSGVVAIKKQMGSDGVLHNTSGATGPSAYVSDYQNVPHSEPQLYGQGAYFNMLSEVIRLK